MDHETYGQAVYQYNTKPSRWEILNNNNKKARHENQNKSAQYNQTNTNWRMAITLHDTAPQAKSESSSLQD